MRCQKCRFIFCGGCLIDKKQRKEGFWANLFAPTYAYCPRCEGSWDEIGKIRNTNMK
jgi:hypothetical protein